MIELGLNKNDDGDGAPRQTEIRLVVNDSAETNLITIDFGRLLRNVDFTSIQARNLGEILIAKANLVEQRAAFDWNAALTHFREVRRQYTELVGVPNANQHYALEFVFRPLIQRFYKGERSAELYRQMMNVR